MSFSPFLLILRPRHDGPWHWLRSGATLQQDDIAAFATNPIPGEQLCLAGDAWDLV